MHAWGSLKLHGARCIPPTIGRLTRGQRGENKRSVSSQLLLASLPPPQKHPPIRSNSIHPPLCFFLFVDGAIFNERVKDNRQEKVSVKITPLSRSQGRLLLRCCIGTRYMEWFDYTMRAAPLLPSLTNKYFSNLPLSFPFSGSASVSLRVNLHTLSLLSLWAETSQSSSLSAACLRACLHESKTHCLSLIPLNYRFPPDVEAAWFWTLSNIRLMKVKAALLIFV